MRNHRIIKGAEALKGIIRDASAFFDDVRMNIEVSQFVDSLFISVLWKFMGPIRETYRMPRQKREK